MSLADADIEKFRALPLDDFQSLRHLEMWPPRGSPGMTISLVLGRWKQDPSPLLHIVFSGVFALRVEPDWQLGSAFYLFVERSDDPFAPLAFAEEEGLFGFRCASFAHAIELPET
jgi:hypothetical protein